MKRLFQLTFGLMLIAMFMVSCTNEETTKRLQKIDSLRTELKAAQEQLLTVDTARIEDMHIEIHENVTFIQENYKDTMEKELAIFIGDYARLQKYTNKVNDGYVDNLNGIEFTFSQLNDLQNDVEREVLTEEQFNAFFQSEAEPAREHVKSIEELVKLEERVEKDFEKHNQRIEKIVNKLKEEDN